MKPRLLVLALLFAAAPALATGGFSCEATDGSGVGMSGTIGHVVGAPLVGATLRFDGQSLSTTDPEPRIVIARSWIDENELRIDLADPQLERFEAQLRARKTEDWGAEGTLVREGRTYSVRCELE